MEILLEELVEVDRPEGHPVSERRHGALQLAEELLGLLEDLRSQAPAMFQK